MAKPPTKAVIDTEAQAQDGPVPATIIKDSRDTRPKRVFQVVAIVVVVCLVGRVVQFEIDSAQSRHQAESERHTLIITDQHLSDSFNVLVGTVHDYGHDLRALRRVIQQQNTDLITAGLVPVRIPKLGTPNGGGGAPGPGSPSTPRSHPTGSAPPSPQPSSHPSHHPTSPPSSRPTHRPSPNPTPHPIRSTVCQIPLVGPITCGAVEPSLLVAAMVAWLTLGID